MKRFIAVIMIMCMLTPVLCACGSSKTPAGTASAAVSPDTGVSESGISAEDVTEDVPENDVPSEEEIFYEAPTIEDLKSAGISDSFQLPEEESYLSSKEKMFIVTPSATVFSSTQSGKSVSIGGLVHGDEVTVLAKQKSVACVLCRIDGVETAGWVAQSSLGYNNTKNTQKNVRALDHAGVPGIKAIRNCGQEKSITLPEEKEYISSFDRMYVCQTAVNALASIEKNASVSECGLLPGDEVSVIALRDNLACILFDTDCGEKAGWVAREQLSYNDPRKESVPVSAPDHAGVPDKAVLEGLGLEKNINLPEDENYTAIFDKMYIVPTVVQVFSVNTGKLSTVECMLVSGSEVSVIAIQEKLALILFMTDSGEKAGWVALSALSYHNPRNDNEPTFSDTYSGSPGVGDIERLGLQKSMTLPEEDSYISSFDRMFVVPNNIKVFSFREKDNNNEICTLASGSEVSVIAIQEKYACILFESDEGTKCGWIALDALYYNNPKNKPAVVQAVPHSGRPDMSTLEELGLDKSLTLPDEDKFTSSYDRMFNSVSSLQVFSHIEAKQSNISFTLQRGSEVNVIAVQDKYALILAQTDEGEKAGWVKLESLLYNNPEKKASAASVEGFTGTPSVETVESLGLDKSVTLPGSGDYLPVFDRMFVLTPNTQVMSFYEKGFSNVCCSIPSGSEVCVMAISKQSAFILFETDQGTKCGWVQLQNLGYNDPSKTPGAETADVPSGVPGEKDIAALGMEKSMTLPDQDSYLEKYEVMKTLSNSGAYSFNSKEGSVQACTLAKDSAVVQIAKQKGYACVLCKTDQGIKALWVQQTLLKSSE